MSGWTEEEKKKELNWQRWACWGEWTATSNRKHTVTKQEWESPGCDDWFELEVGHGHLRIIPFFNFYF